MFEGSADGNFSIGFAVSVELIQMQGDHQKRSEIDILDGHLAVQRKGVAESEGNHPGKFSRAHGRSEFEPRALTIRNKLPIEASNYRLTDSQIHHAKRPLRSRGGRRTPGFEAEGDLSIHRKARRLQ